MATSSFEKLAGKNHIHFGPLYDNYVVLPIIPDVNSPAGLLSTIVDKVASI